MKEKYLDQLIDKSLRQRKKVELYLCKNEEGGFGIKIDGKIVGRNFAWEVFEIEIDSC